MTDPRPEPIPEAPGRRDAAPARELRAVALLFLRLGFTAFGGPAAHIALMEDEVVVRRRWLDRQHFLDLVGALNFIPGPTSTELAINLGLIRAGFPGLVVAGTCFILPAVLIIVPLAWAYVTYGQLGSVQQAMHGISAAVVAVVAVAGWRFARTAVKDGFTGVVVVAAAAADVALRAWVARGHGKPLLQPDLTVLAAAAVAGVAWYQWLRPRRFAPLPLLLGPVPLWAAAAARHDRIRELARLGLFFLKVGATLIGSGYVLVSYLQSGLVDERGWLTPAQLTDAIAVGQLTPGPLLTTSTFVGYLRGHAVFGTTAGGVAGAVVATAAIFLPAFVFVAALARVLPRLRRSPAVRAALDGVNAAVVALIGVVAVQLGWGVLRGPAPVAYGLMMAACLVLLMRWNVSTTWVILASGIAGVGLHLVWK